MATVPAAVACAALLAVACGGPDRMLVVHSSLPDEVNDYAEEAFEEARPDVDVRIVAVGPEETLERLRSGEPQAIDVWWGAPGTVLAHAAEEGLLSRYRPDWAGDSVLDDPDEELWHPSLMSPFVIAFNRDSLSLGQAPRDWIDMFHFRFRGEVALPDPAASGPMAHFIGAMLVEQLRGGGDLAAAFDWLLRLDASVADYVRDPADLLRRLRSGDALVTILPRHVAEAARHGDAPWLHYRFPESGAPVLTRGIAIPAGSSAPQLARAFVDIAGTAGVVTTAMLHTRWTPARRDLEAPELPEDFQLDLPWTPRPPATDTLAAELTDWLRRWEAEVRGRGRSFF